MTDISKIEERLNKCLHDEIMPVSHELHVGWPNLPTQLAKQAQVLFLGNHSSGKSSFINHLLGEDLQDTGMAPTDDGFTMIVNGATHDTIDGHAAVSNPSFTVGHLRNLGPAFLSRFKVKTCPSSFLNETRLVDSPGMIDHQVDDHGRGYHFKSAVRSFAESSDLILLFFDPDKPGTTGETMDIYTETLSGLEHKMVILLHKVDQMENLSDFARSYGTLCWNLSRQASTKDMPKIYMTFIPEKVSNFRKNDDSALDLSDFEHSLEAVKDEISQAPVRRIDNLLTELDRRARWLTMVLRIVKLTQTRRFKITGITWSTVVFILLLGGILVYAEKGSLLHTASISLGALLLATTAYVTGNYSIKLDKMRYQSEEELDQLFKKAYQTEFQIGHRADIENLWSGIKPTLKLIFKTPGIDGLPSSNWINRHLSQITKLIQSEIPNLRETTIQLRQAQETAYSEEKDHSEGAQNETKNLQG